MTPGVHIDFADDGQPGAVYLVDEEGEIVSWTQAEWEDDPALVPQMLNALRIYYEYGPHRVRARINKEVHPLAPLRWWAGLRTPQCGDDSNLPTTEVLKNALQYVCDAPVGDHSVILVEATTAVGHIELAEGKHLYVYPTYRTFSSQGVYTSLPPELKELLRRMRAFLAIWWMSKRTQTCAYTPHAPPGQRLNWE